MIIKMMLLLFLESFRWGSTSMQAEVATLEPFGLRCLVAVKTRGLLTVAVDEKKKHIDDLVEIHTQKKAELREIGIKIAAASTPVVVAFVDLAESTRIKQELAPEEWLGFVFEFIRCVDVLVRAADGTVVKRIGDELMLTFKDVQASEDFVSSLITDTLVKTYRYKIALDYGKAYFFRFETPLPDDPYGPMVDRCARIAKHAVAGTAICTGEYQRQLGSAASYNSMGKFALRGFPEPEELFLRSLVEGDTEEYLRTIITSVNAEVARLQGYRFVGRKLTTEFVREFGGGRARAFLARELLNIPELPYSPTDFADAMTGTVNVEEREREFIGYFVEWEGTFDSFTRDDPRFTPV